MPVSPLPRSSLLIVGIGLGLLVAGCADNAAVTGPDEASDPQLNHGPGPGQHPVSNPGIQGLTAVRNATEEYKDLSAAKADGYTQFSIFVPSMGFHFLHESAINPDGSSALDRKLNRTKPEILVYGDATDDIPDGPNTSPDQEELGAVEYAIPKKESEDDPPQHALALFNNAGEHDWHVHPSTHEPPVAAFNNSPATATITSVEAACHYVGGLEVYMVKTDGTPTNQFFDLRPPSAGGVGLFGNWTATTPEECPETIGSTVDLGELLVIHGPLWTLHAWVWLENPDGPFHPTNAAVLP